ncbi:EscU/YscU/HrcU family type III secretion system export apparatus switch protein [Collimonas sp.]|uniref:EscU/YscU/HrcU family type III secretion system export apparatus switch protein n=1 Tax=Collimonas sp. TaxID=1963772 RepID=UPI002BB2789E|nr:EscU/YscU/HrcU family type III secretion system export apparatus switch protein [Collimonas sp.]HWW08207.1 EscU/YscU/HrcU family type III secretion system export apparatus switch protein [Collimonas sp.]
MATEDSVRKSVIALSHARKDQAPLVVAKGYGVVADAILQRARENGLYVHASPDLVKLLMHVDLDQQIPPQLYLAVAELLAWVYGLEERQEQSGPV